MSLAEKIHSHYVHNRRSRILTRHLAAVLPENASVLDVGCGDGLISSMIAKARPDLRLRGIDVLMRQSAHVPIDWYDGSTIPYENGSFDSVMFVDVLHHTCDPMALIREGARVASKTMIIKDHTLNGLFAGVTLRYMDKIGNSRHGVTLPFNYWPKRRWHQSFESLDLQVDLWLDTLGIYPWPASLIFDRSLHFIARLTLN
jgi:SAM-dependent methyltransferase